MESKVVKLIISWVSVLVIAEPFLALTEKDKNSVVAIYDSKIQSAPLFHSHEAYRTEHVKGRYKNSSTLTGDFSSFNYEKSDIDTAYGRYCPFPKNVLEVATPPDDLEVSSCFDYKLTK
jgi:hypothetical protein